MLNDIVFSARAAREIASRFGNCAFQRHYIPTEVRMLLLADDIIEPCWNNRALRLSILGRSLAATCKTYRNPSAEAYQDALTYYYSLLS